jgi:hypothetical protein
VTRACAWSAVTLLLSGCAYDPAPGITQTKAYSRNLECTRLSQAQAHELYPGKVPDLPPRGSYSNIDALTCTSRIADATDRPARDEVILTSLRQTVGEITRLASASVPEKTTWHVDAFYPQPLVAQKISVAARTDLAERGHAVSDRVPVLAAGDIAVLARMPAERAYPTACRRYFVEKVLAENDAFLGLMIIDARETDLHAGVCLRGEWKWLR